VADSNDYLAYAEKCLEMARTTDDPEVSRILREMAAAWAKVARAPIASEAPTTD
jgi:hypothetical protein